MLLERHSSHIRSGVNVNSRHIHIQCSLIMGKYTSQTRLVIIQKFYENKRSCGNTERAFREFDGRRIVESK